MRRRQWQPTPVVLPGKSHGQRSLVGCSPWGREESDMTERLHCTFHFHALKKEMATHSSTLAWEIPWMEEPGRLQSMGSGRVRHDWATSLSLFTFMHWRRKWQPTPVFLPGESQGREPGGLPSMGSHRVGHDWRDLAAAAVCIYNWPSQSFISIEFNVVEYIHVVVQNYFHLT